MFCWSLFQRTRESKSFLGIEKSAISLNCEQIMPPRRKRSSIKTLWIGKSYEIASWTKDSYNVWSTIRVEWICKNVGASASAHGTRRISCRTIPRKRKVGSAQKWRKEKELFKKSYVRSFFEFRREVTCLPLLLSQQPNSSAVSSGRISGRSWDVAIDWRASIPEFWDARCEDSVRSEEDHHELYIKKTVSLEEQKAHNRFLRERQIAFMIYKYFRVTGSHEAVLDCFGFFIFTSHGDDIQDFTPDGIKFHYQEVRFPMTRFWKICARCEYESLINSKQFWQCTNKKSIKINWSQVIRSGRPW